MPQLLSDEIFDLYLAAQSMIARSRNLDSAKYTLANAREDAQREIGGTFIDEAGRELVTARKSTDLLGSLDRLNLLQSRVNALIDRALTQVPEA